MGLSPCLGRQCVRTEWDPGHPLGSPKGSLAFLTSGCRRGEAGDGPALKKQETTQKRRLDEERLSKRDGNLSETGGNTCDWLACVSLPLAVSGSRAAGREQTRGASKAVPTNLTSDPDADADLLTWACL